MCYHFAMKTVASFFMALALIAASFSQVSAKETNGWSSSGGKDTSNGWSSSGGEDTPISNGSAWFTLGGEAFTVICVERAKDFSISEEEFKKTFKEVLETWRNYYYHKRPFLNPKTATISTFITPMFGCDDKFPFKIYLGLETPEITTAKKKFHKLYGLTISKNPDFGDRGPQEGYMWLADPKIAYPKSHNRSFYAMLLHEMGHVFGNDHAADTIMTPTIVSEIDNAIPELGVSKDDLSYYNYFSEIDGNRMLFFHYKDNWKFTRHTIPSPTLKKITGFNQFGQFSHFFNNKRKEMDYRLKIINPNTSIVELPITITGEIVSQSSKNYVFKTSTKFEQIESFSNGYQLEGYITTHDSQQLPVLINLNWGDQSPVRIRVIDEGKFVDIFK